jgi:PAS domain S-box-containing protein
MTGAARGNGLAWARAPHGMKRGLLSLRPYLLTDPQAVTVTLAATTAAALLSRAAAPLTHLYPFSLFFLAVAVSGWFGGFRQGLLSLILAPFLVHYLFWPLWGTPQGLLRVGLWSVFAGSIAFMLGKLRSFQGQAQTVLANIGEGVVIMDRNWNVVYINESGAPCAVLSPREMIGRNYWEVAPEARGTVFEQHMKHCATERVPVQFEMRTPRRQHWLQVRAYPLPDGICCFAQDITETKEREGKLRSSLDRLATAHKAARTGIFEWSLKTNEISWSEDTYRIHGLTSDQFDGKFETWAKNIHPDDLPVVLAKIQKAVENKSEFLAEYREIWPKGEIHWYGVHGQVTVDEHGDVMGMVGICSDVTDRHLEEEALRRSEKLAAAGRLAATIAHEINNPLAAVTNLLFLMRTNHSPEYLSLAEQEVARISHMVKQTLGFYRVSPHPVRVNLSNLIDDVVAVFRTRIQARGVDIQTQYRYKKEISAFSNELSQVFGNLIGNALEAMQPGGTLRVRTMPCRRGLRVTVADNGSGIPSEHLDKIFEPFFTANKEGGTGLGLWLAREIVMKHGGWIRVRSRSDVVSRRHGTVFMIWLPLSEPRASESPAG